MRPLPPSACTRYSLLSSSLTLQRIQRASPCFVHRSTQGLWWQLAAPLVISVNKVGSILRTTVLSPGGKVPAGQR